MSLLHRLMLPCSRLIAVCAVICLPALAAAQTLSLTFDDGLDPRRQPQAAAWNRALLQALAEAKLKAMLFPAGKVVDSPEGMALVAEWGEQGHAIGNHTYAHRNFGSPRVSLADFTADVLAADAMFEHLPGWTRRLRFPYLKEGESADKRDRLRDWMVLHDYQGAPVSVDTSDWYYSERFVAWRRKHPQADAARFRDAYLAHLWSRVQYYDGLARKLLGRSPKHVVLLHTNAINAEFLPDLIAMLLKRGCTLVPPEEAFTDRMYRRPVDTVPAGESVVWALAKKRGLPGLRYPAEDGEYEKPKLDKLGL